MEKKKKEVKMGNRIWKDLIPKDGSPHFGENLLDDSLVGERNKYLKGPWSTDSDAMGFDYVIAPKLRWLIKHHFPSGLDKETLFKVIEDSWIPSGWSKEAIEELLLKRDVSHLTNEELLRLLPGSEYWVKIKIAEILIERKASEQIKRALQFMHAVLGEEEEKRKIKELKKKMENFLKPK